MSVFTTVLTVFQSYQEDGREIMEGCMYNGTCLRLERNPSEAGVKPGTTRSDWGYIKEG